MCGTQNFYFVFFLLHVSHKQNTKIVENRKRVLFLVKNAYIYAPKESQFELKLAGFVAKKSCKLFLENFSALNWFITHTKPVENPMEIFVSYTP